ncbi:MAG: DUF4038 domain-containing protein [Puniceicoccaceae bacterium]|nr:MAG: DUF4038 domain-containing protein [Puniceicoccaceae bacterium]
MKKLRVSKNSRYLETADGAPFFWMGDTAWELFHRLDRDEAREYLDNRARKGFTVIQAVVLAELDGLDTPNANGDRPLEDNDPTRPNEAYFEHVDFIVAEAAARGLHLGMLPNWGRYVGEPNKWSQPIFTPENAFVYGRFLSRRYADSPVIWILGGDRYVSTEANLAVIRAMAKGVREGDGGAHPITYHPCGPGRSSEELHAEPWLDFNMSQTSHGSRDHDTGLSTKADYALSPVKPTLDGEPRYEGIPVGFYNADSTPLRRFNDTDARTAAYWSLLAGACGHTYGHNSIWQMWEPGRNPIISAHVPWYEAIDHAGSFQMGFLARLFQSRPWHRLRPDTELLGNAPASGPGLVRALFSEDRNLAFIYTSQGAPFGANLGAFAGSRVAASWFDPRYGVLHPIHTGGNKGFQTFNAPTTGYGQDWLLVLEDPELKHPMELFPRREKKLPEDKTERPAEW